MCHNARNNSNEATPSDIALKISQLRGADSVALTGSGTEFLFFTAYKGETQEGYRIPRVPKFNTANNRGVDAYGLQLQELELSKWALGNGIPASESIDFIEIDGYWVLILEVIEDDGSSLNSRALGSIISLLHKQPVPNFDLVAQGGRTIWGRVSERIDQRYSELAKHVSLPPVLPVEFMSDEVRYISEYLCLNHLDFRRQNIRVSNGVPLSIFDWSNSLLGPPEMELARLQEYSAIPENGIEFDEILCGYLDDGASVNMSTYGWNILRLDAAIMLGVVFTSVAPNKELKDVFTSRIVGILSEF